MLISVTSCKVSCPTAEVSGIPCLLRESGEDDVLFREHAGAVLRLVRGRREEERARLDARGHIVFRRMVVYNRRACEISERNVKRVPRLRSVRYHIALHGQFSDERADKRRSLQRRLFRSKRCSELAVCWVRYGICSGNSGLLDLVCQLCNSRRTTSLARGRLVPAERVYFPGLAHV